MIREQPLELVRRPVEVVGGEQPQGDDLDADLFAPAQQRLDVGCSGTVAVGGVLAHRLRPAAVAVEHDADMAWQPVLGQELDDAGLVRRI